MDSDYLKHMTGRIKKFLSLKTHKGGSVSFIDGNKGYIIGFGKIGNSLSHAIDDLYFMDGLKFSLLAMAQISDKGNKIRFMSNKCTVTCLKDGKAVLTAWRNMNMYIANLGSCKSKNIICLSVQEDAAKLWHRRLGHVSCSILYKLVKRDLV